MSQHQTARRVTVLVSIAAPLLQAGVRASLADVPDIEVLNETYIAVDRSVDVVVAESSTAARIAEDSQRVELCPGLQYARILAISDQVREHAVRSALEQGIHGFVLTSSPVCDLLAGVRALGRGGIYLCPPLAQQLAQISGRDALTSREGEVLRLLSMGQCNKSIACDLEIAVGTVKAHVKSIMSKLDASCRTEAARIATERGLVDLPDVSSGIKKPHLQASAWLRSSLPSPSYA
ncbi:response regulator transcription factor [Paraburkholderia fungorum]|uniref:HTH luxR-type domain-containing protein n=1 Tax=Paraburkholderia fungorum TaxID=134537 RepID=A0A3R7HS16_9BURK|nr:response regulator transcription factor [Paraburkholderia fungorum]RKF49874.1 hypothetical protein BCY88_17015 [Paraburkholderia fungorum]